MIYLLSGSDKHYSYLIFIGLTDKVTVLFIKHRFRKLSGYLYILLSTVEWVKWIHNQIKYQLIFYNLYIIIFQ